LEIGLPFIIFVILLALAFDFTNGMHDAANAISTIVSTRVLSPKVAVVWAAFFNFAAFFVAGTAVAHTIGKGMIDMNEVTVTVIFAGLLAAIAWNLITWRFGLPSSSSHALVGGYGGAAVAKAGFGVIIAAGWFKTLIFIALAPLIGMVLGFILKVAVSWFIQWRQQSPRQVDKWSRITQLVSAAAYSLSHGSNDAQKTMGITTSLLFAGGYISSFDIPLWVVLSAYTAIALGTLSGGWRIVKTMGQKITKLRPVDGSCAEVASAGSIFLATHLGVPVSTTHVITGAISGVGSVQRLSAVRWNVTGRIVVAWLLTIPAAALIGGALYLIAHLFLPA
jgi:inorganic phosphate transporter, PiT family